MFLWKFFVPHISVDEIKFYYDILNTFVWGYFEDICVRHQNGLILNFMNNVCKNILDSRGGSKTKWVLPKKR